MDRNIDARLAGPASEAIRNTTRQLLKLAGGGITTMQIQLAAGVLLEAADQVEQLERQAVPAGARIDTADIAAGNVLPFETKARRLALGGAVSAPPRRRGLWKRFQNILRRV